MKLLCTSQQLRLIRFVLILVAVFLVWPSIFFMVDSLDGKAEAAEIQKRKVPSITEEADFSRSVMLGPDHKIRGGDAIHYEIILRNAGSKRPESLELWNPEQERDMAGAGEHEDQKGGGEARFQADQPWRKTPPQRHLS